MVNLAEDKGMSSDTNEIILVRMEGKLDRMNDRMERYERDNGNTDRRIHELETAISGVTVLDLPGRIRTAEAARADHDARITALENQEQQRQGAATVIKILWAIMGAMGVSGAAAIIRLIQVGGI